MKKKDKAREIFATLLKQYPQDEYSAKAKKHLGQMGEK